MSPLAQQYQNYKDEEILALSLEKPSFFGVLVDRYQSPFLRAAFNIVNQREEAEDVVQESFTKIYLNAFKFKETEGASFKSWAYKIVINTSLTHYKKLKRTREMVDYINPLSYNDIPDTSSGDRSLISDREMLISKVLGEIPEHLRDSLKKYYLEDKSQKTIADEENVSVATIKMRLFRARKSFKKMLGNQKPLWII